MCGRYTLTSQEGLVEEFQLAMAEPAEPSEWWRPRFNIAPTQPAPIITNRADPGGDRATAGDERSESSGVGTLPAAPAARRPRRIELARWGLVPPWAASLAVGAQMINARSESAADKRAFSPALRQRRCIVPADGFFEWARPPAGAPRGAIKRPSWIHPSPRRVIGFAGLWERWKSPDGIWIISFTILTTAASPRVAPLHDRQPLVLPRDAYDRWLDPAAIDPATIEDLLRPARLDDWVVTPVSPWVNKPQHDEPACIEPWTDDTDDEPPPQGSLF